MTVLTMAKAISQALAEEMERDPSIVVSAKKWR